MAGEFLRSHGIDLDAEMARIQFGEDANGSQERPSEDTTAMHRPTIQQITNASLHETPRGSRWDINLTSTGDISSVSKTSATTASGDKSSVDDRESVLNAQGALITPTLCHPHIHLDKAYILSHPSFQHLSQIKEGTFQEAMSLTSRAKAEFTHADLLERGRRLIDESVTAGVTHMRAFVEVDAVVGTKCLDAGLELRAEAKRKGTCDVQICAFAQMPLFSPSEKDDDDGKIIRGLMEQAAKTEGVDCLGSTPYVESDRGRMQKNVEWMVNLTKRENLHLDLHLDYNLDPKTEPLVWHVLDTLQSSQWGSSSHENGHTKTVVLGHCTRLTLLDDAAWSTLVSRIHTLAEDPHNVPISLVGLPNSDLYMMRTPSTTRPTLNIPKIIHFYNVNACIGVNNIGNAFTPHGSCDPLALACSGVGVYAAGTEKDAEVLFEAVSTRAREAIGFGKEDGDVSLSISVDGHSEEGQELLIFAADEREGWRTRSSVADAVYLYDLGKGRRVVRSGRVTVK